ncbi:hypothetical protein BKA57DRAFT_464651, partial [Linnemannia elongata]
MIRLARLMSRLGVMIFRSRQVRRTTALRLMLQMRFFRRMRRNISRLRTRRTRTSTRTFVLAVGITPTTELETAHTRKVVGNVIFDNLNVERVGSTLVVDRGGVIDAVRVSVKGGDLDLVLFLRGRRGGVGDGWVDCNQAEHGRNLECPRDSHGSVLLNCCLFFSCWLLMVYRVDMKRLDSLKSFVVKGRSNVVECALCVFLVGCCMGCY